MDQFAKHLVLLLAPLLLSCGPPSPTDDTAETPADSTLESDCASFCGPAFECSEEYAEDWQFKSEQECVDYCIGFTNSKVMLWQNQSCEDTIRAMWVCVGALETCEDFELYEDAAFNKAGYGGKPCADELVEFLDHCN